jgi:hypothetical protein
MVFNLNGAYNGQNPINDVPTNIKLIAISIIPNVPVMISAKNKLINKSANINLMRRSVVPMFFFIIVSI